MDRKIHRQPVAEAEIDQRVNEANAGYDGENIKARMGRVQTDTTNEHSVIQLFEQDQAFGTLTGLVNNAGSASAIGPLEDNSLQSISQDLNVNLLAVIACIKYAIAPLSQAGGGSIVNISSAAAIPMGRAGKPDEIAGAAAWLLFDDAGYATGTTIRIADRLQPPPGHTSPSSSKLSANGLCRPLASPVTILAAATRPASHHWCDQPLPRWPAAECLTEGPAYGRTRLVQTSIEICADDS